MTVSLRSAIAFSAALAISVVASAQSGPAQAPQPKLTTASLPTIPVPDLLAQEAEPQLSGDNVETPVIAPITEQADEVAPAPRPTGDLSSMVAQLSSSEVATRELECLATGIYFESKSEPLAGQLAVGKVIKNRANSGGRFPSSYCGVLFQRGQFSFVRGRSLPSVPRASKQWKTAVAIAKIVDQKLKESAVGNALFFHARRVSPGWRLKRVAMIGNHIFYR
jgi:spore germination cell wall hydrolase CwlJ-like protein